MSTATAAKAPHLNGMPPDEVIFGRSALMQSVRYKIEKLASAKIPVLIQGESGTGKEIIARLIHQRSPWAIGPMVKVNCPAIPGSLMESELFGYEKGAFTGANDRKPGRVEAAQGGVLFLDEIGDLEMSLQAKLLQFLQDGQFCRLGAEGDTRLELQVICATNRPLEDAVQNGTFRQDLFYRINVLNLQLPPLRERLGDIPELARYFLDHFNDQFNMRARPISSRTLAMMQRYAWPGNIRELENLVKRYSIMGSEDAITGELVQRKAHTFGADIPSNGNLPLKKMMREAARNIEKQIILQALQANKWNRKRAAQALSISYRALLYKLKDAGVTSQRARAQQVSEDLHD